MQATNAQIWVCTDSDQGLCIPEGNAESIALDFRDNKINVIFIFFNQKHVVGSHYKQFDQVRLMSTHSMKFHEEIIKISTGGLGTHI